MASGFLSHSVVRRKEQSCLPAARDILDCHQIWRKGERAFGGSTGDGAWSCEGLFMSSPHCTTHTEGRTTASVRVPI